MGLSISGLGSSAAHSSLSKAQDDMGKVIRSIASGSRLTASEDPAGLTIDQLLRSQSSGMQVASQNAQNGMSLLQTADGALGQTNDILSSIRDLTLQASNDTLDAGGRAAIGEQVKQQLAQLDQIASSTSFGGNALLDGSKASGLTFQTGTSATDTTSIALPDSGSAALGLTGIDSIIAGGGNLSSVLNSIDNASQTVLSTRNDIGSTSNALTSTVDNLMTSMENVQSADSSIADTDMASAFTQLSADRIKSQFATALMAQTSSLNKQNATSLLRTM